MFGWKICVSFARELSYPIRCGVSRLYREARNEGDVLRAKHG